MPEISGGFLEVLPVEKSAGFFLLNIPLVQGSDHGITPYPSSPTFVEEAQQRSASLSNAKAMRSKERQTYGSVQEYIYIY